jgi:hypothetical protein
MKPSSIFWGSLLIFLGIFILLSNLNLFNLEISEIVKYWPLLLIIWGVSLLKIPNILKLILSSFSALLIALIIISAFSSTSKAICNFNFVSEKNFDNVDYKNMKITNLAYDSNYKNLVFNFSGGASSFKISDSEDDMYVIKAHINDFQVNSNAIDDSTLNIDFESGGNEIQFGKNQKRFSEIKLNKNPNWKFNVNCGASKLEMDLSKLKTKYMEFDVGAAKVDLTVGDLSDSVSIFIDCGAAKFNINLPIESSCRIVTNTALSQNSFPGFIHTGDGDYLTENYGKTGKHIYIEIEGALSSFKINR